jgi:hypothetical protein
VFLALSALSAVAWVVWRRIGSAVVAPIVGLRRRVADTGALGRLLTDWALWWKRATREDLIILGWLIPLVGLTLLSLIFAIAAVVEYAQ